MPYSGPGDPKLPDHVKKLSADARKNWVGAWNGAFASCRDPGKGGGAGTVEKCETMAFKIANSTIKKEADVESEDKTAQTPDNTIAVGETHLKTWQ